MQRQLIFGTGSLHHLPTAWQRQRAIGAAIEAGIAAFDLAPAYGNGIDELEVGVALRHMRREVVLNTKYGIPIALYGPMSRHLFAPRRLLDRWTGRSARAYRQRDFSPRELASSLEGSLRRLRTDHVDCLLVHEPVAALTQGELDDLVACGRSMKSAGKIGALGIAGPLTSLLLCPSLDGFDVVQTRCADRGELPRAIRDKPLILFGTYAAFRAAGGTDFREFIGSVLAGRERTRVIVASRKLETIRSFRGMTA